MNFSEKDPDETITVTFDFSAIGGTVQTAVVTASVLSGKPDADPAAILYGSPVLDAGRVMHRVRGGLNGTTYALRCKATMATSDIYVLSAALPVKTFSP